MRLRKSKTSIDLKIFSKKISLDYLRGIFLLVSSFLYKVVVTHGARVLSMRPFVFVAVYESYKNYRYPRIDKYGIEKQIPPRF